MRSTRKSTMGSRTPTASSSPVPPMSIKTAADSGTEFRRENQWACGSNSPSRPIIRPRSLSLSPGCLRLKALSWPNSAEYMKSLAWAAFLVFCLGPLCPLSGGRAERVANPSLQSGKSAEDPVIPGDAQEKAILALKALGAYRGARAICFETASILGVSKGVGFDSKQVQKTLKELEAKESKTTITIDLPGDILFDFDKWEIRPDAEATLKKVGDIIKD